MKRFWMRSVLSILLCAALLTGCAADPDADPVASPADPLTGQELSWPGWRPVAVTIENKPTGTTQWGISTASVVLEALTETQRSTSLCLVYPSVEAVPQVGPVTAGQDLYWRLLVGQQVLPVQRGGGAFDQNYLDYYSLRAVDALETGTKAFSCTEGWDNAPLWYTSGSALSGVLSSLNISATLTESRLTEAVSGGGQSATGFSYDADAQVYRMLHADGTPQLDAANGQQAGFDNLLVLFSASALRDDNATLDYDLTLGGGVWLNGGHLWRITWTHGSDTTFRFYDSDGRPLTLKAGRSYLALVSSLTGQELAVQNSAGEDLLAAPEE